MKFRLIFDCSTWAMSPVGARAPELPREGTCLHIRDGPPRVQRRTVHRLFGETRTKLGDRVDTQLAPNFEFHGSAQNFGPKLAVRVKGTEPLALRGSVQATQRTPSVNELNESRSGT